MVKNLSCVSHGSLKRFPHKFTSLRLLLSSTNFTVEKLLERNRNIKNIKYLI